jgi:hypothetical protein
MTWLIHEYIIRDYTTPEERRLIVRVGQGQILQIAEFIE